MGLTCAALAQVGVQGVGEPDWRAAEAPFLRNHVQLTFAKDFVRAGEAYFSPDGEWIVFQAVARPKEGEEADPFYAMYVARLVRENGGVRGITDVARISPAGSANTCGWFHPTHPNTVLMGSTLVRPGDDQPAGFQVGERRYRWMFPVEMDVVEAHPFILGGATVASDERMPERMFRAGVREDVGSVRVLFSRPNYDAECSYDATGRFVLYAHVEDEPAMGRADANIYVYDTKTKRHTALVTAPGYDGGPFFSPDGGWIAYRSDRKGDDLLQLFLAKLRFERDTDGTMVPTGVEREMQVTANEHVNWCPYWHPSGAFLVYATSEATTQPGQHEYEVYAIETPLEALASEKADPGSLRRVRVTRTPGADVLPAFSADGRWMMWTTTRGERREGQARPGSQLWIAEWAGGNPFEDGAR
jgi:TolB protein